MAPLSIGQLIAEKERLQEVVERAGDARAEVNNIDKALELLGIEIPGGKFKNKRGNRATAARHDCDQPGCDKGYATKAQLRSHRRDVHGIAPTGDFKCTRKGCDYAGDTEHGLTMHMRTKHGAERAA